MKNDDVPQGRILVVDDEAPQRELLKAVLTKEGYVVELAEDGFEALERVRSHSFDSVLMDLRMANLNGLEALKEIKGIDEDLAIIMITAYGSIASAVGAMKLGAFDYLTKPLDIEEIKVVVKRALDMQKLKAENRLLKEQIEDKFHYDSILGKSPKMEQLLETMRIIAPTEATVLITGESGTGKELVARALHLNSPRKEFPFIKINCAALPEELLESELFGHEKGAFTSAYKLKKGKFELAHKGAIFLDEIAEMSPKLQAKLLHFLEAGEFERLGGDKILKVDARIITATNKDLIKEMELGRFREDLYYRLNVVSIHLPPLRERVEDIPLLAEHFLKIFAAKNNKRFRGINSEALRFLLQYYWPGNVRELENAIERAVILACGDKIEVRDLPLAIQELADGEREEAEESSGPSLKDMEKELIKRTLIENRGNKSAAAKQLGISRRAIHYKIKEYCII